ncbi:MAG: hypothetical protein JWM16_2970, partial [Verrucomicrobiales bacterium]|nr:hypothetical protein [Verrucomicrobiales bacterium]
KRLCRPFRVRMWNEQRRVSNGTVSGQELHRWSVGKRERPQN